MSEESVVLVFLGMLIFFPVVGISLYRLFKKHLSQKLDLKFRVLTIFTVVGLVLSPIFILYMSSLHISSIDKDYDFLREMEAERNFDKGVCSVQNSFREARICKDALWKNLKSINIEVNDTFLSNGSSLKSNCEQFFLDNEYHVWGGWTKDGIFVVNIDGDGTEITVHTYLLRYVYVNLDTNPPEFAKKYTCAFSHFDRIKCSGERSQDREIVWNSVKQNLNTIHTSIERASMESNDEK